MSNHNRNSNRNPALRLLFVFRLIAVLAIFGAGIYFAFVPIEETESNHQLIKNLPIISGLFIAYSILRGYRLYRDYQNGKFDHQPEDPKNEE